MEKIFVRSRNEWGIKESAPGPHTGMFYRVQFEDKNLITRESRLIDVADTGFRVGDKIKFHGELGMISQISRDQKYFWAIWEGENISSGDMGTLFEKGVVLQAPAPVSLVSLADKGTAYHVAAKDTADLVVEKQAAYGDSHGRSGQVLRQLYPNGIKPEQYDDMLTLTRIIDKLFRIANDKDAFGESPYKDLLGYSLLGLVRSRK